MSIHFFKSSLRSCSKRFRASSFRIPRTIRSRRRESLILGQVQVARFSQVSKGSEVGVEAFASFLVPLIKLEALISFVNISHEIFVEFRDDGVHLVRMVARAVSESVVDFQGVLADCAKEESFLI